MTTAASARDRWNERYRCAEPAQDEAPDWVAPDARSLRRSRPAERLGAAAR